MTGTTYIRTALLFFSLMLGGCAGEQFSAGDVDGAGGEGESGAPATAGSAPVAGSSGAGGSSAGSAGKAAGGSAGSLVAGAGGSSAGTSTSGAGGSAAGGTGAQGPSCSVAEALGDGTAVEVFTWPAFEVGDANGCFRAPERECALTVTSWGFHPGSTNSGQVVAGTITCSEPMTRTETCSDNVTPVTCDELHGSFTTDFTEVYVDGDSYAVRELAQPAWQGIISNNCDPLPQVVHLLLSEAYGNALKAARWSCQ